MTDPADVSPAPEYRPTDLLTAKQIAALRGVTAKTIVNYHKTARDAGYPDGKFPAPSKIIEDRYPRWKYSLVKRYFDQVDARGGPGDFRTGAARTERVRKDAKVLVDL